MTSELTMNDVASGIIAPDPMEMCSVLGWWNPGNPTDTSATLDLVGAIMCLCRIAAKQQAQIEALRAALDAKRGGE